MIPKNHDLDVVMSPHAITFLESAFPSANVVDDTTGTLPSDMPEFFFYPGAACAQGIVNWRDAVKFTIMGGPREWVSSYCFADASQNSIDWNSAPALYWMFRFYPKWDGTIWIARPRIASSKDHTLDISTDEVDRARDA
jgi:hypothetical protein